jgi:pyruvate formate lyase activating enzyme
MREETDYEFRTTVIPLFHKQSDILSIARTISGAKRYVLQQFFPKDTLDKNMASIKPYSKEELKNFAHLAGEFVINCFVRGM